MRTSVDLVMSQQNNDTNDGLPRFDVGDEVVCVRNNYEKGRGGVIDHGKYEHPLYRVRLNEWSRFQYADSGRYTHVVWNANEIAKVNRQ